jgi:hypothetical protein
MEGRVHLNLLQWEDPVYGDLNVGRGGEGVCLCVDGQCYNRVEAGGFMQWAMLACPATEFSRLLVGTRWEDLQYLRQSRIVARGEGFLTVEIVVNSPETLHSKEAERMRMVRRVHTLSFFRDGNADKQETARKNRRVSVSA